MAEAKKKKIIKPQEETNINHVEVEEKVKEKLEDKPSEKKIFSLIETKLKEFNAKNNCYQAEGIMMAKLQKIKNELKCCPKNQKENLLSEAVFILNKLRG